MDPRTFLKPRRWPTPGPVPEIGAARDAPGGARPALLVFLRHVGCPFAEKTMRDLSDFAGTHPEIACIAVSHAAPNQTQKWCCAIGCSQRITVLDDSQGELYASWGLGLTPMSHWLGKGSLSGVMRLAKEGIRNRHPSGTRWQSAGAFAIDGSGRLAWRHIPVHAGDLPRFEEALRA